MFSLKTKSSAPYACGATDSSGLVHVRLLETDELLAVAGGQDFTAAAFKALGPKVGTSATNAGAQL